MRKNLMLVDWLTLVLAIALFASPWVFAYPAGSISVFHAVVAGFVIGAIALGALVAFSEWEEWITLLVGLWVVVAPFVLGFASVTLAMWTHVVIGVAVAVLAMIALWTATHEPPAHTATG